MTSGTRQARYGKKSGGRKGHVGSAPAAPQQKGSRARAGVYVGFQHVALKPVNGGGRSVSLSVSCHDALPP